MCKYCNENTETQEPLEEIGVMDFNPILTIVANKDITTLPYLSVEKKDKPSREILFPINFCPMCGREL